MLRFYPKKGDGFCKTNTYTLIGKWIVIYKELIMEEIRPYAIVRIKLTKGYLWIITARPTKKCGTSSRSLIPGRVLPRG